MLFALIASFPAAGWGTHYLVTDRALEREELAALDTAVAPEPLETFLSAEAEGLQSVFAGYYAGLEARGAGRFAPVAFDASNPTVALFLAAARLNPDARFTHVVRVFPGEQPGAVVPLVDVSPWIKAIPPLRFDFVAEGAEVTPRAILVTYSDEPDWGFDHELWPHTEYGYGEQPYGKPTGESSKAPFHMLFAHENFLVRTFAPEVTEGMVLDRIELFVALSRFAFETEHPYWGYRFAAWAIHYAQDLGQPYHSKALPSVGGGYYVRYVVSPAKDRMKAKATQRAANRHFVYEDFVSFGLEQSYLTENPARRELAAYLSSGDLDFAHVGDPAGLVAEVTLAASDHARGIDRSIVAAFGPEITVDWHYDVETATDYSIAALIEAMPRETAERLLEQTGRDFENTGRATRTVLRLASP